MTIAAAIAALYGVVLFAHCRVTRSLHHRDEEIEGMMHQDLMSASTVAFRQTGTSL
jgi:hypothetical protein